MKNLKRQNPGQLFVAQELINKVIKLNYSVAELRKDKKLVIPTKDLFPCAPERFSNMIDNNFCVRLKKQELTEEEYIEQKEEYLKTGDAKIIIYALNVRHSDAIHLEEMQVMTEETRQQNDGKLFKKLPLLCEQIGIGTLTVSEYLHRNGFFIDK